MQIKFVLSGASLALALALAPGALAAKPPDKPPPTSAITIEAKPAIVVFSGATSLSGRLTGAKAGAVNVGLEQDSTRPYGDSYSASANTMTANNGRYAFAVKPLVNTHYRVVAQASPPVTSAATLVRVRIRVGLTLSDTTPARGTRVRFSG
ncbi:MAG: hypothetical protein ABR606_01915, partial [Vicinamibacterales bacterium]